MTQLLSMCFGTMPSNNKKNENCWTERHEISSHCLVGAVAFQGRSSHMEDAFKIIPNINGSDVSIYGIFDGHAGEFAARYASDIILPTIADKISVTMNQIQMKIENSKKPKVENEDESEIETEKEILNPYITEDNKINYELLLHEEIIAADKILIERMSRALLFCGTTLCVVLIDISNKLIICANVGDSRAVLCDNKGRAIALSHDHKPNDLLEMERIRKNGGFISNKEGCWRVEGSLATSRSLGDYPLKMKKVIIATPDIISFKFKDFKFFPKFLIIASDGLWDVFDNQQACDYMKEKLREHHCGARSLMKKAYAKRSSDNISVISIRFIKPKKPKTLSSLDPCSGTYEWLR